MAAEWYKNLGLGGKSAVLVGCGACLSAAVATGYYLYSKKDLLNLDEGFEELSKLDDKPEKRILVLGLDGAGKSSFLACLGGQQIDEEPKETEGFNVMCEQTETVTLDIWEIGGKPSVRSYWGNFVQDTDLLVFIVDASDELRLPEAYEELHRQLGDERLNKVPILILANKQDILGALKPEEIQHALGMDNISPRSHSISVLGLQAPPGVPPIGVKEARKLMISLVS